MLSCQYRSSLGITCLSKMLQSVRRILVGDPDEDAASSTESSAPHSQAVSSTDVMTSDTTLQFLNCPTKSVRSVETPFHSSVPSVTSSSASSSASKSLHVELLPPSDNSSTSLLSKGKVDEVIHWLEQIFIEKFSNFSIQPTACGAVFSSPHLPPENTVHQPATL
ncbi:unnamed protein product [Lymnaea stagnalis]|uniref:Uncharacterized protein n=1 Tax=Lymnaea stagnalis TaxID=6523 RepID=A0AAV2IN37_LYMST